MRAIIQELKNYIGQTDKAVWGLSVLFLSVLVFLNYHFGISDWLRTRQGFLPYAGWYGIFLLAMALPYTLSTLLGRGKGGTMYDAPFFGLLLLSPALFSWKMVMQFHLDLVSSPYENLIWNAVAYWPLKLVILGALIWVVWLLQGRPAHKYGLAQAPPSWKPYLTMLLLMVPLILLASTQADFAAAYPRWQGVAYPGMGLPTRGQTLLFELSYGLDFLGIELFFRGFLVLAFARYVGTAAILPMAMFYCTIHFGKPLGECISSFFGGTLLGVVTYHTGSVWGGFLVHVGIAWMMETAGWMAM